KHWADGGSTDQTNLVLLCWFHHHLLHEQHWSIKPLGGGHFTLQDPHGQTHQMRPPQIGLTLPPAQPLNEHPVAPLFNPPV
ncbi:HNH endonuclease signature motif containing protein, partial [Ilumatobacter sp.]|uniref:HNH endonuclease signature motif containing protein n=1 Tax=Ilumatobacter sp. TaxID=1967498 RepID=UPI003751E2F3